MRKKEDKIMENKEDRHILNVSETDESVIVKFAKEHEEDVEEEIIERGLRFCFTKPRYTQV